jgi:uncharacterized protein DUF3237
VRLLGLGLEPAGVGPPMTQPPALTFLMQIAVEFQAPLAIADGPFGVRRILVVASGSFEGSALRGAVLPGGGDWVLARRDGSSELDIRFALKTVEGELIYFRSAGLFVASDAVATRMRNGKTDHYYFRTTVLFEAGSARLSHLNRALYIGVGQRTASGMITDVFAVA